MPTTGWTPARTAARASLADLPIQTRRQDRHDAPAAAGLHHDALPRLPRSTGT
ncbi:hypothetical protein LMG29660_01053 [Burkholderia puraquae]|uniref:Uncharacterized protein n=1 Tax=Burkholderia puraquae TaxID=1904757 RepID=A0A6J5D427_9BURK|nr:hypothetical protein [Burkholderia puraquae]CAB3748948.1 hypothetical protein LMG29660_01053 [Burkholderia puraquae]